MRSNAMTRLVLAALFLAVLLLFTYPLWSTGQVLYMGDISNSDITELNLPARYLLHEGLHGATFPLWTQRIGCGFPLLAEGQAGLLYPLNLALFYAFKPGFALNLSLIISLFLALVFSYLLFRQYNLGRVASFYAAVSFSFSAYVMAKLKFTYMINSYAWLPLAIYGIERAFARRNLKYFLLTAFAFAMQILSGGAQVFAISFSAVLVILLWRSASLKSRYPEMDAGKMVRLTVMFVLALIVCLVMGFGFAAPQLIPQIAGYPHFNRSGGTDFAWSLGKPMRPRNLVQMFSPYQYGNPASGTYDLEYDYFWENIAYTGLLTMVLALAAVLFLARKSSEVRMWLAIGVFSLLIALGNNTPLAEILWRYVPGFRMFRFWQRFLLLTTMSLAFLSGAAVDHALNRLGDSGRWRGGISALIILTLVLDLGLFAHRQVSTIEYDRILEDNELATWLKENLGDEPGYRISVLGERDVWEQAIRESGGWLGDKEAYYQFMELLPPNQNIYFGIDGVTQYGDYGLYYPKVLDSLTHFMYLKEAGWKVRYTRSAVNVLALESVKYLLTPFELGVEGITRVRTLQTDMKGVSINVYEIENPMPRAYIASDFEIVEKSPLPMQQLIETMWDGSRVRERVILEEEPALHHAGKEMGGEARFVSYSDRRIELGVESETGGILVLNTAYYPEWEVYVDGERRPLLRTNYAFMGVELEAGGHVVEFIYRPRSLTYGVFILVAALALAALLLLYDRKTRFLHIEIPS